MVANPYQSPEGDLTVDDGGFGEIRFFSPSSRIGRLRYMAHAALAGLAFYAVAIPGFILFQFGDIATVIGGILLGVSYAAMSVLTVIFLIQRLHDLDKSGWLALLMFIPLVNLFFLIYALCWPGTRGTNNFGKRPPPNKVWHWIVGLIFPTLALIGILAAIAIPAYQGYVERANSSFSIDE